MLHRILAFAPIIAGATLKERLAACAGALIGIGLTAVVCTLLLGFDPSLPMIVAPMGASAVLVFAVPSSPMAQPWPVLGGNTLSAFIGIATASLVPEPLVAAGIGVALAILAMSFTRSLHPPGGASALTAVLGGSAVADMGWMFPLFPVALNSLILVVMGYAFHRLVGRAYPHLPVAAEQKNTHGTDDLPAQFRTGVQLVDIDSALAAFGESFDIDRTDLDRLLKEAERQALVRSHGIRRCADIMSRDVVRVRDDASLDAARDLLIKHNIRTLPVVDEDERLVGTVGLRELSRGRGTVAQVMSPPTVAGPDDPVVSLLPALTEGVTHGVVIVDGQTRIVGLITQTDMLATIGKLSVGNSNLAPVAGTLGRVA